MLSYLKDYLNQRRKAIAALLAPLVVKLALDVAGVEVDVTAVQAAIAGLISAVVTERTRNGL